MKHSERLCCGARRGENDHPRRGRPTQLSTAEREEIILDAMEQVVAESGLHRASMAEIARAAGMSKRTLYEVYGSREVLFMAWVHRVRTMYVRALGPDAGELPLAERLKRIFRPEGCCVGSERQLVVLRTVVAEATAHPETARAFLYGGFMAGRRIVRDELARAVARGELRPLDLDAAAELFADMACKNPLNALLDPEGCRWSSKDAEARLDLAIEMFLRANAPETGAGARPAADAIAAAGD